MEFRAEVFNLTNTPLFSGVGNTLGAVEFRHDHRGAGGARNPVRPEIVFLTGAEDPFARPKRTAAISLEFPLLGRLAGRCREQPGRGEQLRQPCGSRPGLSQLFLEREGRRRRTSSRNPTGKERRPGQHRARRLSS